MSSFQTYIGSAFSSYPVRWIESTDAARSGYAADQIAEKPVENIADADAGKPQSASGDVLDLSSEGKKVLESSPSASHTAPDNDKPATEPTEPSSAESAEKLPSGKELTPEEQQQVAELQARDREVRIHEMAHVMAGGAFVTSGPSYTYQTGPDGKGYAIGGSVGIDTSPVEGDPQATIQKMQTVAAAALAPSEPSGQDLKVASAARQKVAEAQAELAAQQTEPFSAQSSEENNNTSDFSVVRSADKAGSSPVSAGKDAEKTSVWGQPSVSAFAPSAAYKAQSVASSVSSRFTAFA